MTTHQSSRLVLLRQIAVAVIWVSAVSVLGQMLTDLGPWYQNLQQPDWKPPDWAFGVIWTSIFCLIVIAGVLAWRRTTHPAQKVQILALFGINSILHVFWSMLFFTVKRPDWALIELAFLWLSIVAIMWTFWRISKLASLILVPYLTWVTVAGFLNYANVQLNGPFGPAQASISTAPPAPTAGPSKGSAPAAPGTIQGY
jgi:tryptophan-rich sensory protein